MAAVMLGLNALLVVLALVAFVVLHGQTVAWLPVVPFVLVAVVGSTYLAVVWLEKTVARESAQRVTTLRFGRRAFDEIDPESGGVVRHAGEPRLARTERARRLRILRDQTLS